MRCTRVSVKLSGESMGGGEQVDQEPFREITKRLVEVHDLDVGLVVVPGGGNIIRGQAAEQWGIPAARADVLGMLATGLNALTLAGFLEGAGVAVEVFSRGPCTGFGTPWETDADLAARVEEGAVVVVAGGLGQPGISSDVAAVRAAVASEADAVVMLKYGVDGVYDRDPRRHAGARLLPRLTVAELLERRLGVMDAEAASLARDWGLPIYVVPASAQDALLRVLEGEALGSVIAPE